MPEGVKRNRFHPDDRVRNVKYMRKRRLHLSATDPVSPRSPDRGMAYLSAIKDHLPLYINLYLHHSGSLNLPASLPAA